MAATLPSLTTTAHRLVSRVSIPSTMNVSLICYLGVFVQFYVRTADVTGSIVLPEGKEMVSEATHLDPYFILWDTIVEV